MFCGDAQPGSSPDLRKKPRRPVTSTLNRVQSLPIERLLSVLGYVSYRSIAVTEIADFITLKLPAHDFNKRPRFVDAMKHLRLK